MCRLVKLKLEEPKFKKQRKKSIQNMEKKQNSVYLEALKWEKQHQQAYQFLPARLLYNLYQKISSLDLLLPLIYSLLDGFSISHLPFCSHQDSATIFHVYGSKSKHSDTHMSTNTDTNTDIEIDGESEILTENRGCWGKARGSEIEKEKDIFLLVCWLGTVLALRI